MNYKALYKARAQKTSLSYCYDIIKNTLVTEKNMQLAQSNKIVLKVSKTTNKIDIKRAVEEIFKIKVNAVNTMINKPREKRFKQQVYQHSHYKKAILTIDKAFDVQKMFGAQK